MTQTPAIWLFEEDVKTRSWLDWLTAHTSFLLSLHRYRGRLIITDDHLELQGRDKRTREEVMLQPLRLTYDVSGESRTLYLIANYRMGQCDNAALFAFLQTWAA